MIRSFATAAVTASLLAAPAFAQSTSKSGAPMAEPQIAQPAQPMAPAAPRFSWTGGYVGGQLGFGQTSVTGDSNRLGGTAGVFAGYRMDMGQAVLGVEGVVTPVLPGSSDLPGGDSIRGTASLLLSAGMPFGPDQRTLAYVNAGPTIMRTGGSGVSSETSTGATLGVGVDYMLNDNTMLRTGLSHTQVKSVGAANARVRTTSANVGVGFKF
ncbi:outer membrane protein [Roseinatronobacter alkalisoli]|uniref:Outer membrane beta-barrel protein n=1 Tax=Roseinatronobacter alkalisoli TaxID=3028235 RepID=A0ABT5TCL2_9RHOB|nr:outer membrane beta-barrel protein [Roseinatronobacter sp. HJB301]MDD7972440.1 outer membrane beta-barrel protein [Roseinatronobacter sp. HJB301]